MLKDLFFKKEMTNTKRISVTMKRILPEQTESIKQETMIMILLPVRKI